MKKLKIWQKVVIVINVIAVFFTLTVSTISADDVTPPDGENFNVIHTPYAPDYFTLRWIDETTLKYCHMVWGYDGYFYNYAHSYVDNIYVKDIYIRTVNGISLNETCTNYFGETVYNHTTDIVVEDDELTDSVLFRNSEFRAYFDQVFFFREYADLLKARFRIKVLSETEEPITVKYFYQYRVLSETTGVEEWVAQSRSVSISPIDMNGDCAYVIPFLIDYGEGFSRYVYEYPEIVDGKELYQIRNLELRINLPYNTSSFAVNTTAGESGSSFKQDAEWFYKDLVIHVQDFSDINLVSWLNGTLKEFFNFEFAPNISIASIIAVMFGIAFFRLFLKFVS